MRKEPRIPHTNCRCMLLYIQSMVMPIKVTRPNGEEEITTLAKEWPEFRKKLKL